MGDSIVVGFIAAAIAFSIAQIFGFLLLKQDQFRNEALKEIAARTSGGQLKNLASEKIVSGSFTLPTADFARKGGTEMREDITFYDEITIEAGHELKEDKPHFGKFYSQQCKTPHGHTFRIRLEVCFGNSFPHQPFLLDLKLISKILEKVKDAWEHTLLKKTLEELAEEVINLAKEDLEEETLFVPALKWLAVEIREGSGGGVRRQRYFYFMKENGKA